MHSLASGVSASVYSVFAEIIQSSYDNSGFIQFSEPVIQDSLYNIQDSPEFIQFSRPSLLPSNTKNTSTLEINSLSYYNRITIVHFTYISPFKVAIIQDFCIGGSSREECFFFFESV